MIEYVWDKGLEPNNDTSVNGVCSTDLRPDENDERIQKIKKTLLN